ncbi:hypothetical protein PNOK_0546200 [Pyrrhoderma noxium]|uniref:Uncharacterized protein n=1 Tax=Pyrrhoderma noxium TaxID=2282107 RepID=A0A286UGF2_9AGAM|nr:hypothetical protein PNOK_0546200 [Pyrrhoderma noxium]
MLRLLRKIKSSTNLKDRNSSTECKPSSQSFRKSKEFEDVSLFESTPSRQEENNDEYPHKIDGPIHSKLSEPNDNHSKCNSDYNTQCSSSHTLDSEQQLNVIQEDFFNPLSEGEIAMKDRLFSILKETEDALRRQNVDLKDLPPVDEEKMIEMGRLILKKLNQISKEPKNRERYRRNRALVTSLETMLERNEYDE